MKNKFRGVGVSKPIKKEDNDKKSSSLDDEKVCFFEFSVNTKILEDKKSIETRCTWKKRQLKQILHVVQGNCKIKTTFIKNEKTKNLYMS